MVHKRAGVAAALTAVAVGLAATPIAGAETARDLLDRVHRLNQTTRHWTDRVQRLRLTIVDRRGGTRERRLRLDMKRYPGDARRSLLQFSAPPEVRGIALLQWVEPHRPDRHWLYLPELKRVRQITGSSKRESFVGTDFSYEDLTITSEITDWTEADARAARAGEEEVDGHACAIIALVPVGVEVGYAKIRLWLGRDDLVVHRYQFADSAGRVVKTLLVSDVRLTQAIPTAYRLEMRNERGGSRTVVVFDRVDYDTGLEDSHFSQRQLEHGL